MNKDFASIYSQLRFWENLQKLQKENIQEIQAYENGKPFDSEASLFEDDPVDAESRIAELEEEIMRYREEQNKISDSLATEGINAEAVVTGFDPELRHGGWLHNWFIEKHVQEDGNQLYAAYEGDRKGKAEAYSSLEAATVQILSKYDYLREQLESPDEALHKLRFLK